MVWCWIAAQGLGGGRDVHVLGSSVTPAVTGPYRTVFTQQITTSLIRHSADSSWVASNVHATVEYVTWRACTWLFHLSLIVYYFTCLSVCLTEPRGYTLNLSSIVHWHLLRLCRILCFTIIRIMLYCIKLTWKTLRKPELLSIHAQMRM